MASGVSVGVMSGVVRDVETVNAIVSGEGDGGSKRNEGDDGGLGIR